MYYYCLITHITVKTYLLRQTRPILMLSKGNIKDGEENFTNLSIFLSAAPTVHIQKMMVL